MRTFTTATVEKELRKVEDGDDVVIDLPLKYPIVESKLSTALIGCIKPELFKAKIETRKFNDFHKAGATPSKRIFKIITVHYKVAKGEESMNNMQALMTLDVVNTIGKDDEENLEQFLTKWDRLLQAGGGDILASDAELATMFVQVIEEVEAMKIAMFKMKPERDRVF